MPLVRSFAVGKLAAAVVVRVDRVVVEARDATAVVRQEVSLRSSHHSASVRHLYSERPRLSTTLNCRTMLHFRDLFISMYVCLSVCLSVRLSDCRVAVCRSVCRSVCVRFNACAQGH